MEDISDYRNAALATLTSTVEFVRGNFITDLPGQELLYTYQAQEAKDFLVDTKQDLSRYPLISAAVGPYQVADDPTSVATIWATKASQWAYLAGIIDKAKRTGEYLISSAEDTKQIDLALWDATATIESILKQG
jgi:hypothetical protein